MSKIITPDDHLANITLFLEILSQQIKLKGVIHVGAHQGEEVESYLQFGFERIMLIEANPGSYAFLQKKYSNESNITVYHYAVHNFDGFVHLHIHASRSGNTEPSSILPLKKFKEIVKSLDTIKSVRVPAIRLDSLFAQLKVPISDYNFLSVDVQGAELLVFQGGQNVLRQMDAILSEVNVLEMYEGCALEEDVVRFLEDMNFVHLQSVYHELYDESARFPAWGESLFIKKTGG